MTDILNIAQGMAHALLFGILVVAGTGKFVGCLAGGRIMCAKASLDLALALATCLVFWPPVAYSAAALAIGIAAVGWLGEIVRKSKVCNCFGVLTTALEPWRNIARAGMIGSGTSILLLGPREFERDVTGKALGVVLGLVLVLVIAAFAFARATQRKKTVIVLPPAAASALPTIELSGSTMLGAHANGKAALLADVGETGKPLVLLFSSRSCSQCKIIKDELEPLLGKFPFPVYSIIEGTASQSDGQPQTLFAPKGTLRRELAILGVPAMVVIDPDTMKVTQRSCEGPEMMLRDMLRILLGASQRQHADMAQPAGESTAIAITDDARRK